MPHTHSLINHEQYIILASNSVIKYHTKKSMILCTRQSLTMWLYWTGAISRWVIIKSWRCLL